MSESQSLIGRLHIQTANQDRGRRSRVRVTRVRLDDLPRHMGILDITGELCIGLLRPDPVFANI